MRALITGKAVRLEFTPGGIPAEHLRLAAEQEDC
ncbi:hypothetical protein SAMN06295920_103144 [Rhizorhabdus histidinilytica]|uniref:Uncharacterized protein n=1 Tax=Rhizorhabdus histidinilytica TaxID=439228 RepID=A0A1T5BP67_9SPHN|nr:hypothetical protein SAMN06295920_103144 [Rhizorhabdus histidinilytica]